MSKERNIKPEKAIENLRKDLKENIENSNYHYRYLRCLYSNRDIEIALNYIDKLQKKVEQSQNILGCIKIAYQVHTKDCELILKDIEKWEKMLDK